MSYGNITPYGRTTYNVNGLKTDNGQDSQLKNTYMQGIGLLDDTLSKDGDFDLGKIMILGMMSSSLNGSGEGNSSQGFSVMMSSLLRALNEKDQQSQMGIDSNKAFDGIHITDLNLRPELLGSINNSTNKTDGERIEASIKASSEKHGISEDLIRAIIKVESNFNPNCVSSAGAMGLMQLMPCNVEDYGVKDPFNIEENIDAGTRHIKDYLKMFNNDLDMALAAYNFGPGNMKKRGINGHEDFYKLPTETKNYLVKIRKYYNP